MNATIIQVTGVPSVAERLVQRKVENSKRTLAYWDQLEQEAEAKGLLRVKWQRRQHFVSRVPNRKLPPLPLHLSSLHLEAFIEARCLDLGLQKEELLAKGLFYTELRYQVAFEAFMLGFPTDYINERFECHIAYVIKNYCGNIGIQKVRERYGIGVYSRTVLGV